VRRLGHDEAIVVVSNQRPIWTTRWWWNREAREAPSDRLGPAKAAVLAPPADPPRPDGPASPAPALRDLAAKLERLDDDELEDLDDEYLRRGWDSADCPRDVSRARRYPDVAGAVLRPACP
jgi:hypothetical protein